MNYELKPCPHCGGTASLYRYAEFADPLLDTDNTDRFYVMVRCGVCGATGSQKEVNDFSIWKDWEQLEKADAASDCIDSWNLRCIPQDIEAMIDDKIAAAMTSQNITAERQKGII